jgi:hypothetical protein
VTDTDDVGRALAEIANCLAAIKLEGARLRPRGAAGERTQTIVALVQNAEQQLR